MHLWNQALTSRGCCAVPKPIVLEEQIFAKPWFDARGLMIAVDDQLPAAKQMVGAALAGFGPAAEGYRVDPTRGIISLVMVHPEYRQKGVGAELLSRAEAYL